MRVATLLVFVLMVISAVTVSAQTPFIAVYFDDSYQTESTIAPGGCPGVGVLDTLYIALTNANAWVSGVEFAVDYPPQITHMADLGTQPVTVGTTPTGISMGWGTPQNGYSTVPICAVMVLWNCDACPADPGDGIPMVVLPNPATNFLGYTDFPNFVPFNAVGLTSYVCATVPTEDTTWGKVKALYGE